MALIGPSPFLVVYGVAVFLLPWLIYGIYIVRGLMYAHSKGIGHFSLQSTASMRMLRQTDSRAAFLHKRAKRWFSIRLIMCVVGFATMGVTLYLVHQRGMV